MSFRPQHTPPRTPGRGTPRAAKSMLASPSLPVLPGMRQFTPKRTSFGRIATFQCGAGGVMLEKERPLSSPSRQESMGSPIPRSPALLRPSSAFESSPLRLSGGLPGSQHTSNSLTNTLRRKESAINALKTLEPLAINQQRVALQREVQQLEAEERQLKNENFSPNKPMRKSASALSVTKLPKWVEMDKDVLRWYAYSKDTVPESRNETYRIRKFVMYYYLSDGTMRINEPKIVNSGLPGGDITERSLLKNQNGRPFLPSDFRAGTEIVVNCRCYRIVDCDVRTLGYFKNDLNIDFGVPENYPLDPFVESQKFTDAARMKNPKLSRRISNEALLGGRPALVGHPVVKPLETWIKMEGKLLKFIAVWDNSDEQNGTVKSFQLVYFLEDDTIEVRNELKQTGAVPFPLLVKRGRIPKDFTTRNEMPDLPIGRNREKYYCAEDLICGQYVHVYGRDLMLCSCDKWTEMYYEKKLGITQVPVIVKKKPARVIEHKVPEYNGWGSEADSLASCISLTPTPVKRDMLRFLANQGQTLRYVAAYSNPKTPAEKERKFVFTYYLEDQTVSIFEPAVPNSGSVGGKFLERGEYKRAIRTKSKHELDPNAERNNHPLVKLLKQKMAQFMGGGNYMLLNAFKHFGGGGAGADNITLVEFKQGCLMCGLPLSKKEAKILFNFYDLDGSGAIGFQEFVDGVMSADGGHGKFGAAAAKSTARWIRPGDFAIGNKIKIQFPKTGAETDEFIILGADEATLTMMEMRPAEFPKSNVEHIIKEIATKLAQYNVNIAHTFKIYDTDGEGKLSHDQFKTMLNKWAMDFGFTDENLSEQDLVTLIRYYDEDGDGHISFSEFGNALKAAPIHKIQDFDLDHLENAERRLYELLHGKPREEVRHAFQEMDERGDGHITIEEFHHFLKHHRIEVSDDETAALMLHYDPEVKGYFNFENFCDFIEAPDYLSAKRKNAVTTSESKLQNYIQLVKKRENKENEGQRLQKLVKSFTRTFLRKKTVLRKVFLARDVQGRGIVSRAEFEQVLKKVQQAQEAALPKKHVDEIIKMFFPDVNSALPYDEFMEIIFKGDIESFKNLAKKGCNLKDKNTWGNIHLDLDPNFDYLH